MFLISKFLAKRPMFRYKTSKFYFFYFLLQKKRLKFQIGKNRKKKSHFFYFLYLKKFFFWFYNIKSNQKLRYIFSKFLKQLPKKNYNYFFKILFILERFLNIFLYRLRFATTINYARLLIRLGLVYINGKQQLNAFFIVPINSIVEVLINYLFYYFNFLKYYQPFNYYNFFFLNFIYIKNPRLIYYNYYLVMLINLKQRFDLQLYRIKLINDFDILIF